MNFGIIGAGPAGIFSALMIREQNPEHTVTIFDGNQKIGRKLFATGNGRCNITNMNAGPQSYFSIKPENLNPVFDKFGPSEIRKKLMILGIPTVQTEDGWVYPQSYSASNVVQILTDALQYAGVEVHSSAKVTAISLSGTKFVLNVEGAGKTKPFDRLILTSGSHAFPQLGANTSILSELFQFGHRDLPFVPALAPVSAKGDIFKALQGVRVDAEVTAIKGKTELGSSFGNIIFTDYGLNGPGVMNLSHLISDKDTKDYMLRLNFVPGDLKRELDGFFYQHINRDYPYRSVYLSVLPGKLVEYFFKIWKLDWETTCRRIDSRTFRVHLKRLENGLIPIEGNRGFNFGQAAAGGIPLAEVDLHTMQSRKQKGLYFAGEVLDVLGPCGGYNLTWAISTGMIAGLSAGKS
ncbi:MAG: aminoacetone oxidase family FAD-binding enzyme [Anaerolineaceae bacterium]|nr:aminoacetone oxidase family FAD-binding enzyme [Anaerolineaceae bacterium]